MALPYVRIPRTNTMPAIFPHHSAFAAGSSSAVPATDGPISQGSQVDSGSDVQTPAGEYHYFRQHTGAVSGDTADFRWYLGGCFACDPDILCKVGPSLTTDVRMVVGLCDVAAASVLGSDTPTEDYAMFQYSTARGDSTWQFVTGDGTTQELTDTGVAISASITDPYLFRVMVSGEGTVYTGIIYDVNGEQLWAGSHSTNVPAATDLARSALGIETLANATIYLHEWHGWSQFRRIP